MGLGKYTKFPTYNVGLNHVKSFMAQTNQNQTDVLSSQQKIMEQDITFEKNKSFN